MHKLVWLALVLAATVWGEAAFAQSPARIVSGTVIDATSRAPIANARVQIDQAQVATNADGGFSLPSAAGSVTVSVEADGFFALVTTLAVPESGLAKTELS